MKERPILFSAPMVRAILDGKKTQTRRIVKPQPKARHLGYMAVDGGALLNGPDYPDGENDFVRCPYGVAGDRLWVRETWSECRNVIDGMTEAIHKAGPRINECEPLIKWRPSIHMPRWASRITLEVVAVRVERLHDITEEDAIAEGAQCAGVPASLTNRGAFAKLWEKVNGSGTWAANPWVWVVEFRNLNGAN